MVLRLEDELCHSCGGGVPGAVLRCGCLGDNEIAVHPWDATGKSAVPLGTAVELRRPYLEQCHAVVALKDAFCLSLLRRIGSCRILQYQESNFLTFSCALFSREHSLSVYVCTACVFFEQSYVAVSKRHRIIACCVDLDFWMPVAVRGNGFAFFSL